MANKTWQQSSHSNFVRGAFYGLAAVSIWAAFIVVSRLGVRTSLTPWDVAAIRFGTAGLLLLPYLMKRGLALDRLGWIGLAAISVGCGAPMVLLVNAGLLFAPAAHGGALFPGVMPLMVAMLAAIMLKEALTPQKDAGLVLIVVGPVMIVWATGGTLGTRQNIGHILFLCAGLAWAAYTVAMRHESRATGWSARGRDRGRCLSRFLRSGLCDPIARQPVQCAGGGCGAPGRCAGYPDCHRCASIVRTYGRYSRRDGRSGLRGSHTCHNGDPGYTSSRRMAFRDRLARDLPDFGRRVSP